jgi:hypothetical protein
MNLIVLGEHACEQRDILQKNRNVAEKVSTYKSSDFSSAKYQWLFLLWVGSDAPYYLVQFLGRGSISPFKSGSLLQREKQHQVMFL